MKTYISFLFFTFSLLFFNSCTPEEINIDNNQLLVIENGAMSIEPGQNITYTAALIDLSGNKTTASNVTWSSGNSAVASISASGQVSIGEVGISTIKASVEIGGVTLTAEAPLVIQIPGLFVVAPSAILVDTEFPDLTLAPIYLGTGSSTYSYQSSNASIATVSSTGIVNFVGAGSCQITVTANGLTGTPVVVVPVVVLGAITIPLPISRIVMTPNSNSILKTETTQYTAKAYNFDNQEVSTSFNWSVVDPTIASVDATGNITPLKVGTTMIRATSEGITGSAELVVAPNKVIIVDPYYATVPAGQTKQFTAKQYEVVRAGNGELALGSMTTPTNLTWEIPTYGFSILDIATVDNNGLVTVKSTATIGLITYVMASHPSDPDISPGVGVLSVAISTGGGGGCNCGTQDVAAVSLNLISPNNIILFFGQTAQIQAEVLDAFGNPISSAALVYCSDNIQVADVDFNGEISATSFMSNSATITVCHGNLSKTITVDVQ
jgi:hypothetical protein